jgi:hypothetical protein
MFIYILISIESKFIKIFLFIKKKMQEKVYRFNIWPYEFFHRIPRSEVPFKQIKALSEQHAIGIDYDYTLWEYINGTWTWIRNNVRSASINYNGDIFYVDNNNIIYKTSKNY